MEDDRISRAIQRIEAATSRIGVASDKLGSSSGANSELEARHEKLRDAASKALSELDQLIEGLTP